MINNECYHKGFIDGRISMRYELQNIIIERIKEYDDWIKKGGDYTENLEQQKYSLNELLENIKEANS